MNKSQVLRNATSSDMATSPIRRPDVHTVFAIILVTVVVIAFVGNFTLILMIVSIQKLRSVIHKLLLNLLITDILMALLVIPIEISKLTNNLYFVHGIEICELSNTVFFLSLPASAWSLFLLTFERYVMLKFPYSYKGLFTKVKTTATLLLAWAYFILIASLPVIGWRQRPSLVQNGICRFFFTKLYAIMMIVINFTVPILVTLVLNIGIFLIAEKAATTRQVIKTDEIRSHRASLITFAHNNKAARRIFLLVGVFVICWLPYIVVVSLNVTCKGCLSSISVWICLILNYSSCATNPVLYGWMNPSIRKELKRIFSLFIFKCTNGYVDLNYNVNRAAVSERATRMRVSCDNDQGNTCFKETKPQTLIQMETNI